MMAVPLLQAEAGANTPLLDVRGLRVALANGSDIVSDIDLSVAPGEIVGLIGESGSGKTTIATALLGHVRAGAHIVAGTVCVDGTDLLALRPDALRAARGHLISHVPQDPVMALNPMMRIGDHLDEVLHVHAPELGSGDRLARIAATTADAGLPSDNAFLRRFPHQLSGGQQQRVLLALAFVTEPKLIVLDEPTTALDVTTQAQVLDTIRRFCRVRRVGAVYVSHDLAIVRELVDSVVVLYAGHVVESARRDDLFAHPAHPYTRSLLAAVLDPLVRRPLAPISGRPPVPGAAIVGCAFSPRCSQRTSRCSEDRPELEVTGDRHLVACNYPSVEPIAGAVDPIIAEPALAATGPLLTARDLSQSYGSDEILKTLSFDLRGGRCTALVGESGSGKTTLSRLLVGLGGGATGELRYADVLLPLDGGARSAAARRDVQYIFQNPYGALNPRLSIGETLTTALRHFFPIGRLEARRRAVAGLARVGLPSETMSLRPGALSGGERQRVAICRALICEPKLLICDEITSALDVSVQASILVLLRSLQEEGLTLLFVTHDLSVVRAIADDVIVLRSGNIVETGTVTDVLDNPVDPYTRRLIADSVPHDCTRAPLRLEQPDYAHSPG